ncbi:TPA: restriction endonuclease subunit S [Vibrio parahaemolyticus]|uniref:restriction endonuclease subunit S n=1 Tax=Vibrio parahaemolyticus TaxID=670 RepID=UPI0006B264EF|nr:restriction endonuclease subunit S [Vibrio parahaemolyticus]MCR9875432.1 restriction endonuclease subunit S [Vibrio parahaemolyticus]
MSSILIGDIADIVSKGTTPTSVGLSFAQQGIPFLRGEDVVGRAIDFSKVAMFVDEVTHQSLHRSELKYGDVLITIAGTIGRIGFIQEQDLIANCNQAVAFVRSDISKIDPEWLCYLLQSPSYQDKFAKFVAGGAIPNVSLQQIRSIQIPNSPIESQRKIATGLKAQLAEVETARHAAQLQLSDVHLLRARMLKAFFAKLDSIPKKRLGDYAHTTSGVTPSRSNAAYWQPAEVAWVKTGEIDFSPITYVNESISKKALAECSLSLLPPKTVLIAITGEGKTRGRSAVLEVSATTNQHSVAVLPNEIWDAEFLQLWLQASYQDLRDLSEGRGGSRSALTGGHIRNLEIPAPTTSEQQQLVAHIKTALTEIDTLEQSSKTVLADIEKLPARILAQAFEK